MVRDGSVVCPGSDAAVIRIKADSLPKWEAPTAAPRGKIHRADRGLQRGLRLSRPLRRRQNRRGGSGAEPGLRRRRPLGTTDNLNFANPHNPELFWQLKESVRGLAEACRFFNAPVTGGNCSLYNQSPNGPIDPDADRGDGRFDRKAEHITTQWFKDEGDAIILLGDIVDEQDPMRGLGGSAWLQCLHGLKTGRRRAAIWKRNAGCTTPCAASLNAAWSRARTIAAKAAWRWRWPRAAFPGKSPAKRPR
jgi:phosphoribosylformylglycinamidine synthase subunit PurL